MYLPENHYCAICGEYLGPDNGDADCGGHVEEEEEKSSIWPEAPAFLTFLRRTSRFTRPDKESEEGQPRG